MEEMLHEMVGLSVDHYVAVVAVEVGCHVLRYGPRMVKLVRERRAKRREARKSTDGGQIDEGSQMGGSSDDGPNLPSAVLCRGALSQMKWKGRERSRPFSLTDAKLIAQSMHANCCCAA